MRFTRDWGGNRLPIHCCLLDGECWRDYREFHMPMRIYFHCLKNSRGYAPFITVLGKRRFERWFDEVFEVAKVDSTPDDRFEIRERQAGEEAEPRP